VVYADALPYDQGYLRPEDLMRDIRVTGRGGTVLQPAVRLLEGARDFPVDAPILIITDGDCDSFSVSRVHAFLVPRGRRLPFAPRGPVFYME
jgi:predicted metal-dependent peptidase